MILRPTGAGHVFGSERVRVADTAIQVAPQGIDTDMHSGDGEAGLLERGGGSLGIEIAEPGGFDTGVTDLGDFRHRGGEIIIHAIAERPELESDGNLWHREEGGD